MDDYGSDWGSHEEAVHHVANTNDEGSTHQGGCKTRRVTESYRVEIVGRRTAPLSIPVTSVRSERRLCRTSMVSPSRIEMTVPEKSAALIAETANNCNANGMRLHAWR